MRNYDNIQFVSLRKEIEGDANKQHDGLTDCYRNFWRYGKSKIFTSGENEYDVVLTEKKFDEKKTKEQFDINQKYAVLKAKLESVLIRNDKDKNMCNELNMSDVIFDMAKKYDTDYYIVFDETPKHPFVFKDITKFKILYKQTKYKKGEKIFEYFVPNIINVKGKAETPDPNLTYPVIMVSEKFNSELGMNNLTMSQIKNIYYTYYANTRLSSTV
jgi:hypothetical protein